MYLNSLKQDKSSTWMDSISSLWWQDVGFVLIFSDLHLGASIFAVIMVNYIFMDGKSDYLQGK